MNISFKTSIYCSPEFYDFLLVLLEPSKLLPSTGFGGEQSITLKDAKFMGIQELERRLREWSTKNQFTDDINFELESIELTDQEKKRIKNNIVFEKVIH